MKDGDDLWTEFTGPDAPSAHRRMFCGLCGNSGVIDTRGHIYTAAGVHCGVLRWCICPNGRAMKAASGQERPK